VVMVFSLKPAWKFCTRSCIRWPTELDTGEETRGTVVEMVAETATDTEDVKRPAQGCDTTEAHICLEDSSESGEVTDE